MEVQYQGNFQVVQLVAFNTPTDVFVKVLIVPHLISVAALLGISHTQRDSQLRDKTILGIHAACKSQPRGIGIETTLAANARQIESHTWRD